MSASVLTFLTVWIFLGLISVVFTMVLHKWLGDDFWFFMAAVFPIVLIFPDAITMLAFLCAKCFSF